MYQPFRSIQRPRFDLGSRPIWPKLPIHEKKD